ncbi:kinase-like domain-containing protein [Stachybotrys elegans]|uniref:EKC/KEOPS complex subunit BUD32 n=1 Tax=Stachybotrys elegans TaxID=80388 RepID=A0A8K0T0R6_9HYPO|nr:kinase-like domain-containing protein [Stachybotrys elegans]
MDDDLSFDYSELDHAPPTAQGTYLEGINEGVERLDDYQSGGYHPLHLGDVLAGRYRVIHKLGHGGFGTVWLCRDTQDPGYVAVKVIAGDVETVPDLALTRFQGAPGAELIAIPRDHFSVTGPNGTHQCIVLPVLGPCVSPDLWLKLKDPGLVLRRMAYQAAQALGFLHRHGLCHGDFRPSNILVKLKNLNQLPEDRLLELLGPPLKAHVRSQSGDLPASSPQYLVCQADTSRLGEYMTDDICVIDFGESFPIASPPPDLGMPENYLPPEVLLGENAVGLPCDLWALGCTLFEIREQLPLFYMITDPDELLAEFVRFFGKPPRSFRDKWEAWGDFFDEQGRWIQGGEDWSLEVALSKPIEVIENGRVKALITSAEEQKLMADLLYKLFQYEPDKRWSVEDVLAHDWFKMR